MAGKMKNSNSFPQVVQKPTRYTGGKNANVTVEKNPTMYKGGMNAAACDVSKYMKK